jgi:cbb3-type cytochrome oxidase subunit 3
MRQLLRHLRIFYRFVTLISPMAKSKKIFLIFCFIFFLIMAWIAYDFATRTTFPGSKNNDTIEQELTP